MTSTSVGTENDVRMVMNMASEGLVKPHIEMFEFEEINDVLGKLRRFEIQGRSVLRLP